MANKRVYEVDLKVDGLISNYRRALQVMRNSGATDKTLAPLERSLESIETELLKLRQAGKEGILGDPNSLKAYDREVQNAYKRLERLGNSFQVLAADSKKFNSEVGELERVLRKANTEADKAQRKMAKVFSSLDIDSDTTSRLLNEIKTQEQLNNWIEKEKRLRQENLRLAGEQERQARIRARQEAAGRFAANLIQSQSGSANSLSPDAVAALSRYSELEANGRRLSVIIQEINSKLVDTVARSNNLEEVWAGLTEIAQQYFITVDDTGREITGSMDVDSIFGNTQSFKDKLSSILSQTEKFYNSSAPVKRLRELTNLATPFNPENEEATVSKLNAVFSAYIQRLNEARAANSNLAEAQARNKKQMQDVQGATSGLASSARDSAAAQREQVSGLIETAEAAKKTSESFQQLKNHVLMFFSVSSLISIFRQQIRKTFDDVKTLDKSFASIAMVTTKSVGDMWQQYNQYADMAIELGQRTSDVIDASALFYQQGLEVNDALELTRNTMQLATLAGIDYTQATDEMTAAIRGFRMEMDQGAHITDVYSTLAAHAAASVNDIAQAMVRTSSIANSAGMSFENTAAFLTQMIETTQESPENIGEFSGFLNN